MEERVHRCHPSPPGNERNRGAREREREGRSSSLYCNLFFSLSIYPSSSSLQLLPFTSAEKLELPAKDRSEPVAHPPPRINSLEIVTLRNRGCVAVDGNGRKRNLEKGGEISSDLVETMIRGFVR